MGSQTSAWAGKKKGHARAFAPPSPVPPDPISAPNRNDPIQLSEEDIMKTACNFEEFSRPGLLPGVAIRNAFGNTEDLIAYGVSESIQRELWKEEITRLAGAVRDMDVPICFIGSGDFDLDCKDAYESLTFVADKMLTALHIVIHDSNSALLEHLSDTKENAEHLVSSRERLQRFVANHNDEDDEALTRGAGIRVRELNHVDYFEFVNYVTATIARMFCKAASGKMWHNRILAKSAKITAKVKVVAGDLLKHAMTSLENIPASQLTLGINDGVKGSHGEARGWIAPERTIPGDRQRKLGFPGRKESLEDPFTTHKALARLCSIEEGAVQAVMFDVYQYVLSSLRGPSPMQSPLGASYEMCAMVYTTGYDSFPVLLFQDMDGDYLGSSSNENINVSHASFQVMSMAVNGLARRRQRVENNIQNRRAPNENSTPDTSTVGSQVPPSAGDRTSVGTTISWYFTEPLGVDNSAVRGLDDLGLTRMPLNTMSDVITVMIPMILASPIVASKVTEFIGFFAFHDGHFNDGMAPVLYRPTEFKASFCLTTDEYHKRWGNQPGQISVSPLSASLVARDTLLAWHPGKRMPRRARTKDLGLPSSESSNEERKRQLREEEESVRRSLKQLEDVSKRMEGWVFEENGVRVRCDWYVGAVSALAAVLVAGGIAAGITMGQRLSGVDPFNITTFSWVLAAFVILIAKGIRVASWTWWDFLHRQVLCRSVSELSAVTGIDDQFVLARLLQDESKSPLQTRGPYNTVYSHKASGGDGFSIDRPMSIRTMLLSGLIMIRVQTVHHGNVLVCLDLRKGTESKTIRQVWESELRKEEFILSDRLIDEPGQGTGHRIILRRGVASWNRVIGVHGQRDSVFY